MTDGHEKSRQTAARLDRPSLSVPSVDRAARDTPGPAARKLVRARDRSAHRASHNLYEDMLN